MKKVFCSHSMNTTKFVCKDPDSDCGRRFFIPVVIGQNVLIDERIQKTFPSTFIPVKAAPEAESEEIKDVCDDATDDAPAAEPAPVDAEPIEQAFDKFGEQRTFEPSNSLVREDVEAANAKETADELDAEILAAVIADAKEDEDNVDEEVNPELIKTIDDFTSKKKLDVFAADLGVKLDGRKRLEDMKQALKEALEKK